MKLHVQCDRCRKFAEGRQVVGSWPDRIMAPDGWTHLRSFAEPIAMNQGLPAGELSALLCGDCMPPVQRAVEAEIGSPSARARFAGKT